MPYVSSKIEHKLITFLNFDVNSLVIEILEFYCYGMHFNEWLKVCLGIILHQKIARYVFTMLNS